MNKNIQLEELQAIDRTASALRKFIFLYEKDSSIDPVCMTIEELFRRILSNPTESTENQNKEFLGLQSLKDTLSSIQNRLNDIKGEVVRELGGSNQLNTINQSIASITRIIQGDAGNQNNGLVKRVEDLARNLQALSNSFSGITQSNTSITNSIQTVQSTANAAKTKSEENERVLNEITGSTGMQLLGWAVL